MIKSATINDISVLVEMAVMLWGSHDKTELSKEFEETIKSKNNIFFIKYINNNPVGFAHCSLRHDYVEGTSSSPVGYLEGIYIKDDYRGSGYAKELLDACINFAKQNGCSEFASDCELDNNNSLLFHKALGFEEVNRVICFKKNI